jgi:hypothetical protein
VASEDQTALCYERKSDNDHASNAKPPTFTTGATMMSAWSKSEDWDLMQLSPLHLALLSSAFTCGGVLLAALVAGLYNLRAKRNEYINDYYKTVIQRRIAAYEQLEGLIIAFKTSVVDENAKPYHLPFSGENPKQDVFKRVFLVMSQGLWLSEEAFRKTTELNYLLFRMPDTEGDAINFGKQHYQTIATARDAFERTLAADMLELHKVGHFLRQKKKRQDPGFQPVRLNG